MCLLSPLASDKMSLSSGKMYITINTVDIRCQQSVLLIRNPFRLTDGWSLISMGFIVNSWWALQGLKGPRNLYLDFLLLRGFEWVSLLCIWVNLINLPRDTQYVLHNAPFRVIKNCACFHTHYFPSAELATQRYEAVFLLPEPLQPFLCSNGIFFS